MTVCQALEQAFRLTISLTWLSLPLSFPLLSLPPSLPPAVYRRPSISVVCQHAFSFGLLLQGARRWQITTRQPVIFDLSELSVPPPPSPAPRSRPGRHQSARTHIQPFVRPSFHFSPPPPPSHPPFFDWHENLAREFGDKKEILCQGKRLSWRRQPWLCYYLGLCHHRWPQRVESIDRLSLKAFSRLHWQSLSRPLIARLAALAEAQEKSLTEPHYMVAFNQSPGPRSGLITVRK